MKCCFGCVPPKRHTACWDHCPEYIEEKKKHDMRKEADYKKNLIGIGIYQQKMNGVIRAIKRHGGKRRRY